MESNPGSVDAEDDSLITHNKCSAPRAKIFLVTIVSFVVAACVVLLVVLTRVDTQVYNNSEDKCPDVAVVGAGLAGVYVSWRLRQSNLSVKLYELSDHAGGQFKSLPWPHGSQIYTRLDLGASYFFPQLHTRLWKLITHLGLSSTHVPDNSTSPTLVYHLRGKLLSVSDIQGGTLPYFLQPLILGNLTPIELSRYLFSNIYEDDHYEEGIKLENSTITPTQTTPESITNSQYSVQRHLLSTWRYEVFQYLQDALSVPFYHGDLPPDFLQDFYRTADEIGFSPEVTMKMTVDQGMSSIVEQMLQETSDQNKRFSVHYLHKLTRLESWQDQQKLHFIDPRSPNTVMNVTCSRAVVLALPPHAMQHLDISPKQVSDALQPHVADLQEVAVLRTLLIYVDPWWRESRIPWTSLHSYTPLGDVREVYVDLENVSEINSSTAVLEITASGKDSVQYWSSLLDNGDPYQSVLSEMNNTHLLGNRVATYHFVRQLQRYLREVFVVGDNATNDEFDLPWPRDVVVMKWDSNGGLSSREQTVEGGMWFWQPGVNRTARETHFRTPMRNVNIHLVGSSYAADYRQMWAEGALQTVEDLFQSKSLWQ